ncbi:MAG: hypothetical protein AB1765_09745 [Candidatus Hydrogenedentota bacterium]
MFKCSVSVIEPKDFDQAFLTIKKAISEAQSGDEIIVYEGNYYKNINLL